MIVMSVLIIHGGFHISSTSLIGFCTKLEYRKPVTHSVLTRGRCNVSQKLTMS